MTHQEAMAMEQRELGGYMQGYVRDEVTKQVERFKRKLAKKMSKRFGLEISFNLDLGRVETRPRRGER